MKKKKYYIVGAIMLVVILFFLFSGQITGKVTGAGEGVTISLSEISEEVSYFEYELDGKNIKFFAVRSGDGSIKTAFDACDVCHGSKKGYRQEGDYMVCNNCGNKYPIAGIGSQNLNPGGCWPGYLENEIVGENLVIEVNDIKEGSFRF